MNKEQALRIVNAFNALEGACYKHLDLSPQTAEDVRALVHRYEELMATRGIISRDGTYVFPQDTAKVEFIMRVAEESRETEVDVSDNSSSD